jgi:signal transduction histidine kinase
MIQQDLRISGKIVSGSLTRKLIDDFIYRSAHDLRGPLATIQGLVNLLRMRKDDSEVDRFVDLIDTHAKKLDERLHHLVYFAQSEDESLVPSFVIHVCDLETHLRKIIERNSFVDFLELDVTGSEMIIKHYNEILIKSLLSNILLHVLSLEKEGPSCTIEIHIQPVGDHLRIAVKPHGFIPDSDFSKDIKDNGMHVYSELLQSSKLTYFYAAKKIAAQLNALMAINNNSSGEHTIVFEVPRFTLPDAA